MNTLVRFFFLATAMKAIDLVGNCIHVTSENIDNFHYPFHW